MNIAVHVAGAAIGTATTPWPAEWDVASRRNYGPVGRVACAAVAGACRDAGIPLPQFAQLSTGLAWGTRQGDASHLVELIRGMDGLAGARVSPRRVPTSILIGVPGAVSIACSITGPVWCMTGDVDAGGAALATAVLSMVHGGGPPWWVVGSDALTGAPDAMGLSGEPHAAAVVLSTERPAHVRATLTGQWPRPAAVTGAHASPEWSLSGWVNRLLGIAAPAEVPPPAFDGPQWVWAPPSP